MLIMLLLLLACHSSPVAAREASSLPPLYLPVFSGSAALPERPAYPRDVWSSPDGQRWELVQPQAPWVHGDFPIMPVHDHRLWVMGGWSKEPFRDWNDVWYSRDGLSWHRFETQSIWAGRHTQASYVFRHAIWIAGGLARPLSNETWMLQLPGDWTGVCESSNPPENRL